MSIAIPAELPIPSRDTYGDTWEESRARTEMDQGAMRQRRVRSSAPRLFTVTWELNLAMYAIFDYWYQNVIDGGAKTFDMQVLDDDESLVWYTVMTVDDYQFQVDGEWSERWIITMTVRAMGDSFTDRSSGTNLLRGVATNTVGGVGQLQVLKSFFGSTTVGMPNGTGRLITSALRGIATVGTDNSGMLDKPIDLYGLDNVTIGGTGQLA